MLSYLVGRPVRTVELAKALGVARFNYCAACDEGRLPSADNLLRLADVFGLNPVDFASRHSRRGRSTRPGARWTRARVCCR